MWVQRQNGWPLMNGAGLPGVPMVISTLPSSVHLRTQWAPSSVQIDRVVGSHVHAMGTGEHAFAPGTQKVALAVEHDHRMLAAVEHVDVVVAIDANGANLVERPAIRQAAPAFLDAITIVSGAQNHGHAVSPKCVLGASRHH